MNMQFNVCRETGPPLKKVRNLDPLIVANLYIFTRRPKLIIRLKFLAKYGSPEIQAEAQEQLKRVAAYKPESYAAWEMKEDIKDKNNVD